VSISAAINKISITAWNTSTNAPATGLTLANFSLEVTADGVALSAIATGNISEDANGEYFVSLSAAQNTGTMMCVRGTNSASNVIVVPAKWNNLAAPPATSADLDAFELIVQGHVLPVTITGATPAGYNTTYYFAGVYNGWPAWIDATGSYAVWMAVSALVNYWFMGPAASIGTVLTNGWRNTLSPQSQSTIYGITLAPLGTGFTGNPLVSFPAVNAGQIAGVAAPPPAVIVGTVATAASGSSFTLTSSQLSALDHTYKNMWLVFTSTSGANLMVPRIISDYTAASKTVTFTGGTQMTGAFPATPSVGDAFMILAGAE